MIVHDPPRPIGKVAPGVIAEYGIAAAVAVNVAILLRVILDWHGLFGSVMVVLVTFLAVHYALVRQSSTRETALTPTPRWP